MNSNKVTFRKGRNIYIIIVIIFFISFALTTLNFCLNKYELKLLEENDPEIYLTGLKGFQFEKEHYDMEYNDGISNLGKTGRIEFECYMGECTYEYSYYCQDDDDYDYDWDDSTPNNYKNYIFMNNTFNISALDTCYSYETSKESSCSNKCRTSGADECGSSYCHEGYGTYYESSCDKLDPDEADDEDNKSHKSCNAHNLILFWNNLFFQRTNATSFGKYRYSKNAIPANQTCEETGRKMCGILDY